MTEARTKKRKKPDPVRILAMVAFVFMISSLLTIWLLMLDKVRSDYAKAMNSNAQRCYTYFADNNKQAFKKMNIPEKGTYYITGECSGSDYYMVYKNEFNAEDVILSGQNEIYPEFFWGIKVSDGRITESWAAYLRLTSEELVPYSFQEQKRAAKPLKGLKNSKVIGYYDAG